MRDATPLAGLAAIPVEDIRPNPANIRRTGLGNLDDLTASIKAEGILNPLLVEDRIGHYLLIAGHRRLAAAKRAGLTRVPCIVRTTSTAAKTTTRMLIENVQRADLHPLDEAKAYAALCTEGLTIPQIGAATGMPVARIRGRLDLLHLPAPAQQMVRAGDLKLGPATQLAKQVKATKTGSVTTRAERCQPHFTLSHRLGQDAKVACDLAGHPTAGRLGGADSQTACGSCWETTIRDDERNRR